MNRPTELGYTAPEGWTFGPVCQNPFYRVAETNRSGRKTGIPMSGHRPSPFPPWVGLTLVLLGMMSVTLGAASPVVAEATSADDLTHAGASSLEATSSLRSADDPVLTTSVNDTPNATETPTPETPTGSSETDLTSDDTDNTTVTATVDSSTELAAGVDGSIAVDDRRLLAGSLEMDVEAATATPSEGSEAVEPSSEEPGSEAGSRPSGFDPAEWPLATGAAAVGGAAIGGLALRQGYVMATGSGGSSGTALWSSGQTVASSAAEALREWGWRVGGLFGYQRFDDTDPLEHDTRVAIYRVIETTDGAYLSEISRATGIPLSTVRYHLKILEYEDRVSTAKMRGKRLYFPAGTEPSALEAALKDDGATAVLAALAAGGPASVSGLAEALDRDVSTISHHLTQLADAGLVSREREGRAVINRLEPDVRAALEAPPETPPTLAASGSGQDLRTD